jgi:hypothetical protein
MMDTRPIDLTLTEAWLIRDLVRHIWIDQTPADWPDGQAVGHGLPAGRTLLRKVHSAILELEAQPRRETVTVCLTESEAWAIEYHVRSDMRSPAGHPVGRQLLLKVIRALHEFGQQQFGVPTSAWPDADEPARDWHGSLREWRSSGDGDDRADNAQEVPA